ncbi:helix-turn-helix transcriptional regulator [Paenibacillus sp. MBLB4367]|uniref:helix-turn-helix transcriptional regulator n=1 Tax=Paenibacillus sp. MBLB4367 TaxID=3384767 RepID=UPI0039082B40
MQTAIEVFKRKLGTLAKSSSTPQEYRTAVIRTVRGIVPFDAACCTSVDPQTLLSTGAISEEGIESIHHGLFANEYMHEDFNRYERLAKETDPVATLSQATGGDLDRSARYRNVLLPAGFHDEMRAALVHKGVCWGYVTMFRRHESPAFKEEERKLLSSLVPTIAYHLRSITLAMPGKGVVASEEDPGIMVLSVELKIISSNAAADRRLTALREWESIGSHTLPRPIRAVCSRALAEKEQSARSDAKVCIRMPEGTFMTIRAGQLRSAAHDIQLAVWFETAKPADILPLITETYGLSEREKQILNQIVRGQATKEIARSLHISAYTVQDHLKSIFGKTGTASRRELIWRLFSRYNIPPGDGSN